MVDFPVPGLLVLWETQLDSAVTGVEPATGDRLLPGEELHTVHAVRVTVAEQRRLPSAEAVVSHGPRNGHVDAHHPDLDLILEAPCGTAVVREDCRAVSVRIGVHQLHCLVV